MDLRENAVGAIQVSVEDYHTGTRRRVLAAVRNIHAGILLLLKDALLQAAAPRGGDDTIIKAKIEPRRGDAGNVAYVGIGKRTIDAQQIQERCEAHGIRVDWNALRRIGEVRNDAEHYVPQLAPEALASIVASAMVLVRRLADEHFGIEPRDLLGQETWDAMLKVAEVYQREREACEETLTSIEWESETLARGVRAVRCVQSGSDLLRLVDEAAVVADVALQCRACGTVYDADTVIRAAVNAALAWDQHGAVMDGATT